MNEVINFLQEFEKNIKEITYDGWDMWFFYKKKFMGNTLIPPLPKHKDLLSEKERNPILDKFTTFWIKKVFWHNENLKILLSKKKMPPSKPNSKKILFVCHTNGLLQEHDNITIDRIGSVLDAVRKDPELEAIISIADPISRNSLLKLRNYDTIYSYIDNEMEDKAEIKAIHLKKQWEEISRRLSYDEKINAIILKNLKPALDVYFSKEVLYFTILYYEAYKKLIREKNIVAVCIYSSSDIFLKCVVAAAHSFSIPTIHIMHGFSIPTQNPEQPSSLYYAVFGDKFKERLVELGVNPENIKVTGATFLDEINEFLEKSDSTPKNTILLATGNFVEANMIDKGEYFDYILGFINDIKKTNYKLIIKIHPQEINRKIYESLVKISGMGDRVEIIEGKSKRELYELILRSDVVFSFGSTVTKEAMMFQKPSVTINLLDTPFEDDCRLRQLSKNESISEVLVTFKELKEHIVKIQDDVIKDYFYKIDGKSGERVVEYIKELIKCK